MNFMQIMLLVIALVCGVGISVVGLSKTFENLFVRIVIGLVAGFILSFALIAL